MNILILGSGGREHALVWKISQSPLVTKLYVMPGNGGTEKNVAQTDLVSFCAEKAIGLVVIGPDDLLAEGVADTLRAAGILVFGPSKAAAQIEWSKAYAKEVMQAADIPTAKSRTFTDYEAARTYVQGEPLPIVVKASGLALGKGVVIATTLEEAAAALAACFQGKFGDAGKEVVIEEYLEGLEFSTHAICAGEDVVMFPASQDHKRIRDNDEGPNTGGMGTIAPQPSVSLKIMEEICDRIVRPLLTELKKRDRPFSGLLYPGIMLTADGPKVLEFNARFGDPETQVYMRLMKSDIVPVLLAAANGDLSGVSIEWHEGAAACIVMASRGYPGSYEAGKEITGIENVGEGVVVFHAGTTRDGDRLRTSGGRVLGVTALGADLPYALSRAYEGVKEIQFEGAQYRSDIGKNAL